MSHSSTSGNKSGSASSSRNHPRPIRPLFVREDDSTHIFPASSTSLKIHSATTRKADPPRAAVPSISQDDNTRRLFGGLQWLLDMSTQPQAPSQITGASAPLSEKAVASFNQRSLLETKTESESESAETAAWVDGQIESRAAPPF